MNSQEKKLKPLNLKKLRKDLQTIMDEIDRTNGILPDFYSPIMWQRLQNTADTVANAIQAVRLRLNGKTNSEVASELGLDKQQVGGYLAWNTMLDPQWCKPAEVIAISVCPKCGADAGLPCDYASAPAHKIHKERREAFRSSAGGKLYLEQRAEMLEAKYGVRAVA
jgi:hypothetical protein